MALSLKSFYEIIKTKKIAFIGLGVSHNELIKKYLLKGSDITVLDKSSREKLGDIYSEIESLGAKFILGEKYLDSLESFDLVFRSPGVKFMTDKIQKAIKNGVFITSELEMFFDLCPAKIYAVTGSDGKTTTTTLISEMLKKEGKNVFLGGNIGKALLPEIDDITSDDVAVVELSSFQLISMRKSPDVAVITNISPNHLDTHKDMNEYIESKINIIKHQSAISRMILNVDNEITAGFFDIGRGESFGFSRLVELKKGGFLNKDGDLVFKNNSEEIKMFNKNDILLRGVHNIENYLAAICAVFGDVSVENIKYVAENFGGVEHRNEFFRDFNGIKFYNDSIASSPTRTIAGLNTFDDKIILIAGGYDKKIPYEPLAPKIIEKVKVLILMGDTATKIEKAIKENEKFNDCLLKIIFVKTMEEAVENAMKYAEKGDIVSLSPASASFGLYKNFEFRGLHFKKIVNSL